MSRSTVYAKALRGAEKMIVTEALIRHKGHRSRASVWLGISRTQLHDIIREHRIVVPSTWKAS